MGVPVPVSPSDPASPFALQTLLRGEIAAYRGDSAPERTVERSGLSASQTENKEE
jgi:hypothetical protein